MASKRDKEEVGKKKKERKEKKLTERGDSRRQSLPPR